MALASNAPTPLKTQALRLVPSTINFPFPEITLTPYIPVPDTNGEEWDRLEAASALDALVELAIHGEYNGLDAPKRGKASMELRAVAATVFEVGWLVHLSITDFSCRYRILSAKMRSN